MTLKLMGKKIGMTQRFDKEGNCIVCTVIEFEPNVVTRIKSKEKDGYNSVQTGSQLVKGKNPEKKIGKPRVGFFKKIEIAPRRQLIESRLENVEEYSVGQEVKADLFSNLIFVDVTATSKGKGYQGVMKLHGFAGIGRSHGAGPVHRHAGSTGMRSTPGRCLPGGKRASRMGGRKNTVQNLRVVAVDAERNLLLVKGAVPGANGSLVYVAQAKKKPAKAA
ncbi:MAG: 50S ribosomal protein L3 [Parachlamydiales bacterium]|nr:50S ribosomal protein L3 [Parachlamydiales bacterium]